MSRLYGLLVGFRRNLFRDEFNLIFYSLQDEFNSIYYLLQDEFEG